MLCATLLAGSSLMLLTSYRTSTRGLVCEKLSITQQLYDIIYGKSIGKRNRLTRIVKDQCRPLVVMRSPVGEDWLWTIDLTHN